MGKIVLNLSEKPKPMKVMSILILLLFICLTTHAQLPAVYKQDDPTLIRSTELTKKYLTPKRIVWMSDSTGQQVKNTEVILQPGIGQADLNQGEYLTLISEGDSKPGIVLDFGREIQGGIEIVTTINNPKPTAHVRIRFGESVAEAMSDIIEGGASNDHAMRDFVVELPWLGRIEIGESGFRFVRIDLVDPDTKLEIKEISAAFQYRDIPYLGSFESSDKLLNDIWMTGAYTVHLNMQNYLWDGIKRDRLVWVGDLHPEVMVVSTVFGDNEVVPKSLDLARDLTPLPGWMNGISSYSMWWVLIHHDWYLYHGNLDYLREQKSYFDGLMRQLASKIDENGKEILDGNRFLDWPSSPDLEAVHAGLQSMMVMTFEAAEEMYHILRDQEMAFFCATAVKKLKQHIPTTDGSKQSAALMALSGLATPQRINAEVLSQNGVQNMSTFYGYYMLQARALSGDYTGALDNIRTYWGGMLSLGATTFWEDFDINWLKNAARIDELVPEGKVDVHKTFGDYSYKSYRHSLCHGWAAGPTAWLTEHVLGIQVLEPGGKKIKVESHLGDLQWVRGSFPTPHGVIQIEHRRTVSGKIESTINAPEGVEIVK